jgi:apolipoprotein N-acyltransferase
VSGLAAAASFEPLAWVWLLVPSVAGLSLAVHGTRGRRAFLIGLLFGAGFMGALLPWISVIGRDAWAGITVLEAAFYGLLGVALGRVSRLPVWPLWTAACWVALELLRSSVPWGGFPWGRLAFATVDTPLANAMAWVGPAGTTFVVALLGATLAWLVRMLVVPDTRRPLAAGLVAATVLVVAAVPALVGLPSTRTSGTVQVAAVQGNVPGEGMEAFAERRAVLDNHVAATLQLGRDIGAGTVPRPDFVLWPENSTDIDPFQDSSVYEDIQRAVNAVGVPVLVGAMVDGPGPVDVKNQSIVWSPGTGPGERYSKTHPVPFGEYIPMRKQLAKLFQRLDQIPRDMVPGTRPGVLHLAGTTVGDVICFEVAYDGLIHDAIEGGAGMLVVPSNNATYMGTGQVEQQFAIARLRAVETGRTVVVVATNGVSGVVAPDGSVEQRAPVRSTQVMDTQVTLRSGLTPGVRAGRAIEALLTLVALAAVALTVTTDLVTRRRTMRRTSSAGADAPEAEDRTPAPTVGGAR